MAQPAGPGSRRRRLDGVSARRRESGGSPERARGLRSPPLCLGFGRGRRPDRRGRRAGGVARRAGSEGPATSPLSPPAARCLQRADWETQEEEDGGRQSRKGGRAKLGAGFSPTGPRDSQAGWGRGGCGGSAGGNE